MITKIDPDELAPRCSCPHCQCDCYECDPSPVWHKFGDDWVTDRIVLLKRTILTKTPVPLLAAPPVPTLLELVTSPQNHHPTQAHFDRQYLDPIERAGLFVVASDGVDTGQTGVLKGVERAHLIIDDIGATVGVLMPKMEPTANSRSPKAAA